MAVLPAASMPALAPNVGPRWDSLRRGHAAIDPMFWGPPCLAGSCLRGNTGISEDPLRFGIADVSVRCHTPNKHQTRSSGFVRIRGPIKIGANWAQMYVNGT